MGDTVNGDDSLASHLEFKAAVVAIVSCGLPFAEFIGGDDAQVLALFANRTVHGKSPFNDVSFIIGGFYDEFVIESERNYEKEEIVGKVKLKVAPFPGVD